MSPVVQFFLLAAIEVAGLFAIWFLIRARVRRYLELENLLAGVREEARALVLELNETADRNVSLVEDRMTALRDLLAEADRRIAVGKRELATRANEREVYAKLSKRRPIVPESSRNAEAGEARAVAAGNGAPSEAAAPADSDAPNSFSLGPSESSVGPASFAGPCRSPEISVPDNSVVPMKTLREEALELHRQGISADLIAARTGATVAEIELLLEIEERRAAAKGGF